MEGRLLDLGGVLSVGECTVDLVKSTLTNAVEQALEVTLLVALN